MSTQETYGLGFSPLSMELAKDGVPFDKELTSNKDLGILGIYHDDFKISISHEYLERAKNQIDLVYNLSMRDGTMGDLYDLPLNNTFGQVIKKTNNAYKNLLSENVELYKSTSEKLNGIRFHLDVDVIDLETGNPYLMDPIVTINCIYKVGSSSVSLTLANKMGLSELNNTPFDLTASIPSGTGTCTFTLKELTISGGTSFDESKYQLNLHKVLYVVY